MGTKSRKWRREWAMPKVHVRAGVVSEILDDIVRRGKLGLFDSVMREFECLPEQWRAVVHLVDELGLNFAEAGWILEIHYHLARKCYENAYWRLNAVYEGFESKNSIERRLEKNVERELHKPKHKNNWSSIRFQVCRRFGLCQCCGAVMKDSDVDFSVNRLSGTYCPICLSLSMDERDRKVRNRQKRDEIVRRKMVVSAGSPGLGKR